MKGLEFAHAVVLAPGALDKKNLYVALTRGSTSLTVISAQPVLHPAD
jgi:DNA helicase-2/ATP-dependent DNA helicase PcrA